MYFTGMKYRCMDTAKFEDATWIQITHVQNVKLPNTTRTLGTYGTFTFELGYFAGGTKGYDSCRVTSFQHLCPSSLELPSFVIAHAGLSSGF